MPARFGPSQRLYSERRPHDRTEAERDHDRILYTSAFQRLAGITQIAAPESGLTVHNRLTHTLKVAQVARRLAKRLGLSADRQEVAAAAALAHDLGHPPFGHLGEDALNQRAQAWGGFEGNAQSFRIVTFLALRSGDYRGLNLTRRTLAAILKYPWAQDPADESKRHKWGTYESERRFFEFARAGCEQDQRSLEAAVVDWSDEVTYAVHDLEDFFRLGLIPLEQLAAAEDTERRRLIGELCERPGELQAKFRLAGLTEQNLVDAFERLFVAASAPFGLIEPYRGGRRDRTNLREQSSYLIGRFINAASRHGERLEIAAEQRAEVAVLKEVAWFYVITDPSLATIHHGQAKLIRELHDIYIAAATDPGSEGKLFPLPQRDLLELIDSESGANRVATDFVAGLTEEMAYELYRRLTGISRGSIIDAAARASR